MRSDDTLLLDMLLAARKIERFAAELSQEQFQSSDLHQSAVIRELQVIGEAARLISKQMKAAHKNIEWTIIAGLRNRIVHEYFRIDLDLLWGVVQEDIPALIQEIELLIPPNVEP